jgi:Glycosyl hydrolase catalytic core
MSRTARIVVGALAAATAVVAVVVVAGGGGGGGTTGTSGTPTTTATTKSTPTSTVPPGSAAPRPGRQGVRRGHGKQPDVPAPGTGALLGIADQKAATFSDPLYRNLGVARSRLNTPWNSIFTEPGRLAEWLNAARAAGVEPLVAFEHARGQPCPAEPCTLPSLGAYTRAVAAFRRAYPWVKLIQPWNEANSATQPTGRHPERAAAYYEAVTRVCPECIVTGADVLDGTNLASWLGRFRAALKSATPQLWGLHNYSDTNRFRNQGTKEMLSLVPGQIWMTEAGGIVSFKTSDGRVALPYDEQRAARAIRYLFSLAASSPRITRVYIYQWKIDFPGNRFDAGLVGLEGKARPALRAVLQHRSLLR